MLRHPPMSSSITDFRWGDACGVFGRNPPCMSNCHTHTHQTPRTHPKEFPRPRSSALRSQLRNTTHVRFMLLQFDLALGLSTLTRSSSKEVRIRVPDFFPPSIFLSGLALPKKGPRVRKLALGDLAKDSVGPRLIFRPTQLLPLFRPKFQPGQTWARKKLASAG